MKRLILAVVLALGLTAIGYSAAEKAAPAPKADDSGWISLFDGKSLDDWKVGNNPVAFAVEDGCLVAKSGVAHLFYDGKVKDHNFKNFEFKADVMTKPKANSGIYFHTKFQEKDWPNQGFEAQVNNSGGDPVRTGSLYNIVPVRDKLVNDNEWFHYYIKVVGKHILIKINDKTVVDWTEPTPPKPPSPGRVIGSGTFAIQGHDPGSRTAYKNIFVRPLPD